MSENSKVSHISVTPAVDEEDIVIQAGAVPESDVSSVHYGISEEISEEQPEVTSSTPTASQPSSQSKTKTDDYHETTLEDIKSSTMPLMQKIIIVVALIAVIAFIVVYILP